MRTKPERKMCKNRVEINVQKVVKSVQKVDKKPTKVLKSV